MCCIKRCTCLYCLGTAKQTNITKTKKLVHEVNSLKTQKVRWRPKLEVKPQILKVFALVGLRPPRPFCFPERSSPTRPPAPTVRNMSTTGHDTCTISILHAYSYSTCMYCTCSACMYYSRSACTYYCYSARMYYSYGTCMYYSYSTCMYYSYSTCMYYSYSECMSYSLSACTYYSYSRCMYYSLSACLYYSYTTCINHSYSKCMYYSYSTCMYDSYEHYLEISQG